jgi:hypothetical protein
MERSEAERSGAERSKADKGVKSPYFGLVLMGVEYSQPLRMPPGREFRMILFLRTILVRENGRSRIRDCPKPLSGKDLGESGRFPARGMRRIFPIIEKSRADFTFLE